MLKLFIILPEAADLYDGQLERLEERAEEFLRDPQKMICVLPPGAYVHECDVGADGEVQVEVDGG